MRIPTVTGGEGLGNDPSYPANNGTARFVDQILVDGDKGGFLNSGDSGSVLAEHGSLSLRPVGLLFASGRGGKIAIANRIDLVLNAFGVTIDGW